MYKNIRELNILFVNMHVCLFTYVSRLVLFKTVGNLPKIHHAPRRCQNYAICMHVALNIGLGC